jgi:putative tricarboxylic transport membrane protein
MSKGLLTAGLGLFIGMIGFNNQVGMTRATFGVDYLFDGIHIVPVVVGMFAFPEIADLVIADTPVAKMDKMLAEGRADTITGMKEAMRHKWLIIRSSLIGVFIGAMPGLGPTPAHWIAYAQARQTEPGAKETFGTGDIRGVIAPEAANNSTDGGVLIPTLLFAIPGSTPMAIILAALILVGIQPGPQMVQSHLDLTIAMVYIIALANIIVVPIVLMFAAPLTKVSIIPPQILAPIVLGITTISAFMAHTTIEDLALVSVFAVLGMFMKAYAWPRPPILIAIVLAPTVEKWMSITIQARGWSTIWQPGFIGIMIFVAIAVFFSLRVQSGTQKVAERTEDEIGQAFTVVSTATPTDPPAAS